MGISTVGIESRDVFEMVSSFEKQNIQQLVPRCFLKGQQVGTGPARGGGRGGKTPGPGDLGGPAKPGPPKSSRT